MKPKKINVLGLAIIAAGAWLLWSGGNWSIPGFVPAGPKTVLIVRETEDTTPEQAIVATGLRAGAHADYLKSKGHSLLILDDDAVNEAGQPLPLLAKFKPYSVPELLIVSPPDRLIHREPLPASADAVMAAIKAKGG